MRARMALKYAQIEVEIVEISLRDKPAAMLKASPKGTVPVLVLPDGNVLEQSLDIMLWALHQRDVDGWLVANNATTQQLIGDNDSYFKKALDLYKYASRFPERTPAEYRVQGETFLQSLENILKQTDYLVSDKISLADIAIFPFIRQFVAVDAVWFETAPYPKLKIWLQQLVDSALFKSVMQKL
jgi:glutathione S-transferase